MSLQFPIHSAYPGVPPYIGAFLAHSGRAFPAVVPFNQHPIKTSAFTDLPFFIDFPPNDITRKNNDIIIHFSTPDRTDFSSPRHRRTTQKGFNKRVSKHPDYNHHPVYIPPFLNTDRLQSLHQAPLLSDHAPLPETSLISKNLAFSELTRTNESNPQKSKFQALQNKKIETLKKTLRESQKLNEMKKRKVSPASLQKQEKRIRDSYRQAEVYGKQLLPLQIKQAAQAFEHFPAIYADYPDVLNGLVTFLENPSNTHAFNSQRLSTSSGRGRVKKKSKGKGQKAFFKSNGRFALSPQELNSAVETIKTRNNASKMWQA